MKEKIKDSAIDVQKLLRGKFAQVKGSLLETTHRLHTGEMSPLEATQQSLDRIEQANERLNCFVTVGREQAEEHAKSLGGELSSEIPLLWGLPVSVKDLTPTQGLITTFSCKAFADYVPEKDAPLVTAMKVAGMTIVGKTNTPEFGILPVTESELNGVCRNPWSLEFSVGGSSGGAAASVAAGLTSIAHGSDGAGSLRIPASCCGVFAVALPHGRLPAPARPALGRGALDGVISRTVADSLYYLAGMNAITGEELALAVNEAPPSPPVSIILTCTPPIDCTVDSACEATVYRAAELLGASGYRISERKLDWSDDRILSDMMLLRSTIPVAYGDPSSELLDRTTRDAINMSESVSALEFHRAFVRLNSYAERILRLFGENEILLTPVLARPSVPHGWITEPTDPYEVFRRSAEFAPFTAFVNLAGLCAVSVPLGWTEEGMPIGVQLASRPNNLARLLGIAAQLERLAPWADCKPPIFFA
ncbi:amidase [Pseudomonas sp. PvR086]